MAIDKKALARAIVPYVYEEAENQGLTTNSGSERLSIDGEIEDPSGESDGLYVEATVKCSCDRDFPMDKDTGWKDTADAKSLSYRVLDATVYTDDDQDIDVTEELQNALSWPDTYGPKKGLKEDFEGEIDPEDPAIVNVADAIAVDVFDQGNVKKGKVYSGTVEGNFGDELDGMYTIKYRVKVTQVGKSAFRSSFTPYSIVMSNDEIGNVNVTDAIAEYWTMYDSARKEAGDVDHYDEDLDPDDPIIENGADAIGADIFEKNGRVVAGKVYSGKITGTFGAEYDTGEDDEFTITYKVKVVKVGKDAWNTHFTPIKVTVSGEGLNVNMTKAVADYWSSINDMHSDESLDEEAGKGTSPGQVIRYNIEQYGDEIIEDVVRRLRKKYPNWKEDHIGLQDLDRSDLRLRGRVEGDLEGYGKETINYDVAINDMDSLSVFGIVVLWCKVTVTLDGKTVDITDDLEENYVGDNLMPDVYDGEYGDDDYYSDELDEDSNIPDYEHRKKAVEEHVSMNIEPIGSDILLNAVRKVLKRGNTEGSIRIKGNFTEDGGINDEEIKYDITFTNFDNSEETPDFDFEWNKVIFTMDEITLDLTERMKDEFIGEDWEEIWDMAGDEDLDEEKTLCESFKSSILANLVKKHGKIVKVKGFTGGKSTEPLHMYTDDQVKKGCLISPEKNSYNNMYLWDGGKFSPVDKRNVRGSGNYDIYVEFEDGWILNLHEASNGDQRQYRQDHLWKRQFDKNGMLKKDEKDLKRISR